MILSLKKYILVMCKMLWLFVNTFTANDKYSPVHKDNFTQRIQMELSQKQKTFSWFPSAVLKYKLKFQRFQKKVELRSECISGIRDSQRGASISN